MKKIFIFIFDDVINFKGTRAILGWGLIEFSNFGSSSNTVPSFMLVSQSAQFLQLRPPLYLGTNFQNHFSKKTVSDTSESRHCVDKAGYRVLDKLIDLSQCESSLH